MVNTILNNLDIWTTAKGLKSKGRNKSVDNISLHGIDKLRELILELAVRGKLVPQDPTDESASILLEKIAVEKESLIKEGKLKKQKSLLEISEEEKSIKLPHSWEWARLGNISFLITDGTHHTPEYVSKGIPFLSVKDMSNGSLDFSKTKFITQEQHEILIKRCHPENGDLLLTKVGTTGIPVLVNTDKNFSIFVSVALIKYPQKFISGEFLVLLFNSPLVKIQSVEGTEGIGNKNLVLRKINAFKITIPPLREQKRIVEKVDELMTICDQLKEKQMQSIFAHHALVDTLLETLTSAKVADEFTESWQRIAEHFDTLFTTEYSIDKLKETILQLAVMGNLVPQDPNDEPASVLLEKINAEKEKLIKEGKIKTQKPLSVISEDEKPFELPNGWAWTRLGETGVGGTGKTPSTNKSEYYGGNIPFIGPGQITSNGKIINTDKFLTELGTQYSYMGDVDDLLRGCIGGSIGKSAICTSKLAFNQQINCIRPILIMGKYLFIAMNTPFFQTSLLEKATGSATPIINRSKWEELLVSIPPMKEQKRIVAKIVELFTICDELKKQIEDAENIQAQLADAVVEQSME